MESWDRCFKGCEVSHRKKVKQKNMLKSLNIKESNEDGFVILPRFFMIDGELCLVHPNDTVSVRIEKTTSNDLQYKTLRKVVIVESGSLTYLHVGKFAEEFASIDKKVRIVKVDYKSSK